MQIRLPIALALIFTLSALSANAGPGDSLRNVTKWEASSGGNDHTYALVAYLTIWDSSNVYASDLVYNGREGYLATISSQAEDNFILNNVIIEPTDQNTALEQFYIGGIDIEGTWSWVTGEPFTFINWAPGEPNNVGIETVIAFWGFKPSEPGFPSGKWNNTLHDNSINPDAAQWFIVEWDEPDTLKTIVLPNPIFAAMYHPVNEMFARFYLGNFPGFYTAADVHQATLVINDAILPSSIEITSHSLFSGDVLSINVPIESFVADYYPFWGDSIREYTITGMFNDSTPIAVTGSFNAIGHIDGDINNDGSVNTQDLLFLINRIFRNGHEPRFPLVADVNGQCDGMNIKDLLYMINYIFRNGPAPLHCTISH